MHVDKMQKENELSPSKERKKGKITSMLICHIQQNIDKLKQICYIRHVMMYVPKPEKTKGQGMSLLKD